jgi:hypothetical protein
MIGTRGERIDAMWVLTKTEWPTLVNLATVSQVGYQQIAKYQPEVRVIASTWEQELVLAECATGEQARAVVRLLARSLAARAPYLDLHALDLTAIDDEPAGAVL